MHPDIIPRSKILGREGSSGALSYAPGLTIERERT
jgi:hypothetical protein